MQYLSDYEKHLLTLDKDEAVLLLIHNLRYGDASHDARKLMAEVNGQDWENGLVNLKALAAHTMDCVEIKKVTLKMFEKINKKSSKSDPEYDICAKCKNHAEFRAGVSNCCESPAYDPIYQSKQVRQS